MGVAPVPPKTAVRQELKMARLKVLGMRSGKTQLVLAFVPIRFLRKRLPGCKILSAGRR
jgi:hypothetical protein